MRFSWQTKGKGEYDDLLPQQGPTRPPGPIDPSIMARQRAAQPQATSIGEAAKEVAPSTKLAQTEKNGSQDNTDAVYVKYRGLVNLAPFKCDAVTRNSFIGEICYDSRNNYMLIELSSTWYHYCDIDNDTVSQLLSASSMGHYYNITIKGRFDCRVGHVPAY